MGPNSHLFPKSAPRRPAKLRCALYGPHAESIEAAVVVPGIMAEEEQSLRLMSVGEGQRVGMLKPHGSRSKCRSSRRCAERRVLRTPADACSRRIAYATFSSGRAPDSALSVVSAVSGLDDQERRWTNLTAALRDLRKSARRHPTRLQVVRSDSRWRRSKDASFHE